ncbi:MAG: ABC transporter ATP-binding protein [Acidobacteriota bacterium]
MSQQEELVDHAGQPVTGYTWADIRFLAWEHKKEIFLAQPLAILAMVADVLMPLLFPVLVDEVLLGTPGPVVPVLQSILPAGWHTPIAYILLMLAATFTLRMLSLLFKVLQARLFSIVSKDIIYQLRQTLLGRLKRISMAEYETLGSGGMASRYVTDLDTIDRFVGPTLSRLLVSALTLVGVAIILLWLHWQLALIILFFNPIVIWITTLLGRWIKELKRRENEAVEDFQGALTETLDGIQQIRASNREDFYVDNLVDQAREVRDHAARFKWQSDAATRLSFVVFIFGTDVFRATSMLMVLFSDLSVGEMIAVFSYLWSMMSPVQELLNMHYGYFAARGALGRINRLLGLGLEPRYPNQRNPFADQRAVDIQIDDVHFAYTAEQPILDGVTLHVEAGERVALVGASGGGKSTLVQALIGLYPIDSGGIAYGGVPLEEIGLDVVREHVTTVLQQPAIFNTTLRDNLTLGRERSDRQVRDALEMAQLTQVVEELPDGLDAVLGRNGIRFSGGQRQRLAIARMMLGDPSVVIMDEATSAIDVETEQRLYESIRDFLAARTTLIISHRLSAVKQVDRALVFESGRIIEQGSHDELIRHGGLYANLYGAN